MQEMTKVRREQFGSGARGWDLFGSVADSGALVTVSHGPYAEQLPVGEMSVGEIRARFRDRFDIDPESRAILDGSSVSDEEVVRPGQHLAFIRRAGEKGIGERGVGREDSGPRARRRAWAHHAA